MTNPGPGVRPAVLSAHRGSVDLGPQQTLEAYKGAIAYGVDNIEVDVRMSADGVLVVSHDAAPASVGVAEADRIPTTSLTVAQFKALNAATAPWTGAEHDPARYQTFAEVLDLARQHHVGMDIEFKDIGANRTVIRGAAQAVEDAGIMDKTIWQHGAELDIVGYVTSVDPNARFNYNIGTEPPSSLYALAASTEHSFGSSLAEFTPDRIAAIHDGCGLSLPHSYDGLNDRDPGVAETAREHSQMLTGIAQGIDGFQTNRPDAAADALDRPVPSRLVRDPDGRACLVNATNGFPLPNRPVVIDGIAERSGKGGCVPSTTAQRASFDGDGSALAAAPLEVDAPLPAVPEGAPAVLLSTVLAVVVAAAAARRRGASGRVRRP